MGDFQGHPFRGNQWTGKGYSFVEGNTVPDAFLQNWTKPRFGAPLTRDRVAELAGASEGSEVEIEILGDKLAVTVRYPDYAADSYRILDLRNRVIQNEEFNVSAKLQGQGVGLAMFSQQVEAGRAMGFKRIESYAAGQPDDYLQNTGKAGVSGYYAWARLGYDAEVEGPSGKVRLNQLMTQPGGASWWRTHGRGFQGTFDLSPDSTSMRVFREYQRLKRQKEAR